MRHGRDGKIKESVWVHSLAHEHVAHARTQPDSDNTKELDFINFAIKGKKRSDRPMKDEPATVWPPAELWAGRPDSSDRYNASGVLCDAPKAAISR